MDYELRFRVNGKEVHLKVPAGALLVEVLRDSLGLTGTKVGCGTGECGSCTVLVDGAPVNSCLVLALRVQGKEVTTIEGLGSSRNLHPLQRAFLEEGALQCGFCGPGMILSAKALLESNPNPTESEVRAAIAGNLCRCTGYAKPVRAILRAASEISRGGDGQ